MIPVGGWSDGRVHEAGPLAGAPLYNGGMGGAGAPEWVIREDAGQPVLLALYLRQVLGIRSPDELPHLRGIPPRANETKVQRDLYGNRGYCNDRVKHQNWAR